MLQCAENASVAYFKGFCNNVEQLNQSLSDFMSWSSTVNHSSAGIDDSLLSYVNSTLSINASASENTVMELLTWTFSKKDTPAEEFLK